MSGRRPQAEVIVHKGAFLHRLRVVLRHEAMVRLLVSFVSMTSLSLNFWL